MTVLVVVLVAGLVSRYRGTPVANAFVWSVVGISVWGVLLVLPGTFGLPSGSSVPGSELFELGRLFATLSVPVFFYLYARLYTGHTQYSTRRKVGFLFAPVVGTTLLVTLVLPVRDLLPALALGVVPVTVVGTYTYVTALLLLAVYLLFRLSQRYEEVSSIQVIALSVGVLTPYAVAVLDSLSEPTASGGTVSLLPVDISFAGFLLSSIAITYATHSYPLFRPLPGAEYIAREEVIENLADGIFILDRDERIIDMNATASQLTQYVDGSPIGSPISTVFEELSRVPSSGVRRITLQTAAGTRQFEVSTSPIQTNEEGAAGRTVRFRDITEQQTQEQQLEVLTRVLRHNVRNDLGTALAYTNEIADPEVRDRLRSQLEELLDMGDKARDVEDVLTKANESRSRVDLAELLSTVTHRVQAEYETATIDVSHPETVSILSHRQLLERLLTELLENGIEHNDSESPHVTVAVELRSEDSIEIEIADNGSGIPDHERQVIESGAETDLAHGSGLGLWLANWIAEALGGELSFPTERSGGVVVVRLSSVQPESSTDSA
jgi:signal transduction histidine kinase